MKRLSILDANDHLYPWRGFIHSTRQGTVSSQTGGFIYPSLGEMREGEGYSSNLSGLVGLHLESTPALSKRIVELKGDLMNHFPSLVFLAISRQPRRGIALFAPEPYEADEDTAHTSWWKYYKDTIERAGILGELSCYIETSGQNLTDKIPAIDDAGCDFREGFLRA